MLGDEHSVVVDGLVRNVGLNGWPASWDFMCADNSGKGAEIYMSPYV